MFKRFEKHSARSHDPGSQSPLFQHHSQPGFIGAVESWCYSVCVVFLRAALLFPIQNFFIVLFCSKDAPNVGLERTTLGLRVPCSTVCATRAKFSLRKLDGVQCALIFGKAACLSSIKKIHSYIKFEKTAQRGDRTNDPGIISPMVTRLR